jgi:hypothetical protein
MLDRMRWDAQEMKQIIDAGPNFWSSVKRIDRVRETIFRGGLYG